MIIQEDIKKLFEYIEPGDRNLETYSYRIQELLIRICIEVEANFKAILRENTYTPFFKGRGKAHSLRTEEYWNINDYHKINASHHLDAYFAEFPFWRGNRSKYQPFRDWEKSTSLSWYQAYNETKHNKNDKIELANFDNLLSAFAGLFVLLSAQFGTEDFQPGNGALLLEGGEFGIGDYLKVQFPRNWTDDELYDFDWSILKNEGTRFQRYNYSI